MQPKTDWWEEAVRLERLDRLREAEGVIERALRPRGDPWDYQCAYLYELRAVRLYNEGKDAAAREAADRCDYMMRSYASGATSGGEGVAFSREADALAARLDAMLRTPRPPPAGDEPGRPE